ncbi:arylamine N-acetyltransferase [Bacillus sp. FJAT-49736]|uniref:arylamine N-acetyltransferase n=1 Tax=Bacillus sp. FJAT-49736 TaxID=2833582 RepID=UPI001BC8F2CB|nr:arylamine N-acetyltransferase [Bacillus sp. FJAT-49736]MBS4175616.1 arylamine N-acetyltransferase [Bacillus sp. FJAT-49736]
MDNTIHAYLKYLKIDKEAPTLNYLQRLIQHHLSLIPYETFSKFHYYQEKTNFVPALETFVENLMERGWGGTCYTLNINFSRLISALGFNCSLVRVIPGHVAIMVKIDERKFYVDVGYGSPIMKPVELDSKRRHVLHGFGEEIIFEKRTAERYEIDRRSNGKSFVRKEIEWVPLTEEDIQEDIESSYFDHDHNTTMRRITAVRFNGHECYFLRDRTIKVMTYRNIREIQLKDMKKWLHLVREVYQIDQNSLMESVDFLEQRGVHLFRKG